MAKSHNKYPRTLVISHNCFSNTQNNGKTLSSFFKGWDKDNIAQLYFWGELPDYDVCKNFYRITDYEILDSVVKFKDVSGSVVDKEVENANGNVSSGLVKNLSKNRGNHDGGKGAHKAIKSIFQKRMPSALLVRDIMWNRKLKTSKKLVRWIDEFKPEVIFIQCSNCVFPYKISLDIAKKYDIPIIVEFTDDYLTAKTFMSPFGWIHHFRLVNIVKKVIYYSSCIFAIGDMMAKEYKERFGGNYEVFMNTVEVKDEYELVKKEKNIFKLLYAGSLHTNRWKTMSILGKVLSEMNRSGVKIQLDIYTNVKPSDEQLRAITYDGVMMYKGSLTPKELEHAMKEYDSLVHVEAFDKNSMHITRLSVSTKIPECLSSGISLFAIGPAEVASIEYLRELDVSFLVDTLDEDKIREKLYQMVNDDIEREKKRIEGLRVAKERHNAYVDRERIMEIFKAL